MARPDPNCSFKDMTVIFCRFLRQLYTFDSAEATDVKCLMSPSVEPHSIRPETVGGELVLSHEQAACRASRHTSERDFKIIRRAFTLLAFQIQSHSSSGTRVSPCISTSLFLGSDVSLRFHYGSAALLVSVTPHGRCRLPRDGLPLNRSNAVSSHSPTAVQISWSPAVVSIRPL
jgi:hypothetical protein